MEKPLKIGVLTFQAPHFRTEELLRYWKKNRNWEISVIALPFRVRPARNPIFQHRPNMLNGKSIQSVSEELGLKYLEADNATDLEIDVDYIVVGGAGLLPSEFVEKYSVVNCHPGIIPRVRGLDAFKWAIYDDEPLGVSLHIIDKDPDMGTLLQILVTPVILTDTLESLAQRHYRNEIELLSQFDRYLGNIVPLDRNQVRNPTMRMPLTTEREFLNRGSMYIKKHSNDSSGTLEL